MLLLLLLLLRRVLLLIRVIVLRMQRHHFLAALDTAANAATAAAAASLAHHATLYHRRPCVACLVIFLCVEVFGWRFFRRRIKETKGRWRWGDIYIYREREQHSDYTTRQSVFVRFFVALPFLMKLKNKLSITWMTQTHPRKDFSLKQNNCCTFLFDKEKKKSNSRSGSSGGSKIHQNVSKDKLHTNTHIDTHRNLLQKYEIITKMISTNKTTASYGRSHVLTICGAGCR